MSASADAAAAGAALARRLRAGEACMGTLLALPSPDVAEVVAGAGFDWLFVDGEHGPFDVAATQAVLRAAGATPCLVRTPPRDDAAVGRALDLGAAGVIVPQVHTAAQAAHVAALAHFPPRGTRGIGVTRANRWGGYLRAQLASADAPLVVVQAESADAVTNADAIARAPGVSAVLVGPNDLAASLGHTGDMAHPDVQDAIGHVIDACRAAGTPSGIFGLDAEAVRPWVARGATLVVAGADAVLLAVAARTLRESLRTLRA